MQPANIAAHGSESSGTRDPELEWSALGEKGYDPPGPFFSTGLVRKFAGRPRQQQRIAHRVRSAVRAAMFPEVPHGH